MALPAQKPSAFFKDPAAFNHREAKLALLEAAKVMGFIPERDELQAHADTLVNLTEENPDLDFNLTRAADAEEPDNFRG